MNNKNNKNSRKKEENQSLEEILKESKLSAEKEDMKKDAEKYTSKSRYEEIFSGESTEYRISLKRDRGQENKKTLENDKTNITMKAEVMMDKPNEEDEKKKESNVNINLKTKSSNDIYSFSNFENKDETLKENIKSMKIQKNIDKTKNIEDVKKINISENIDNKNNENIKKAKNQNNKNIEDTLKLNDLDKKSIKNVNDTKSANNAKDTEDNDHRGKFDKLFNISSEDAYTMPNIKPVAEEIDVPDEDIVESDEFKKFIGEDKKKMPSFEKSIDISLDDFGEEEEVKDKKTFKNSTLKNEDKEAKDSDYSNEKINEKLTKNKEESLEKENTEKEKLYKNFKANLTEPEDTASAYEKIFGKQKPVSAEAKVETIGKPTYEENINDDRIVINAGKFSDSLRYEYQEYLNSTDSSISKMNPSSKGAIEKRKIDMPVEEKERSTSRPNRSRPSKQNIEQENINTVGEYFSGADQEDIEEEAMETVEDYQRPEDGSSIMFEINSNIRKLFMRSVFMTIIAILSVALTLTKSFAPSFIEGLSKASDVIYCLINLTLILVSTLICHVTVTNGLIPLTRIKGNSDTGLAVAAVATIIQSIVALFYPAFFLPGYLNFFTAFVTVGFLLNTIGKLLIVRRVKENFIYITDNKPKYAAKIYNDENIAKKMMRGTVVGSPIIAYQHETNFLSNFLKISYTPDPSEEMAARIAPMTTICSIIIAVIYGVLFKNLIEALTVFALVTALSIPICSIIAANLPMKKLTEKLLKKDAMLAGYPSVQQFSSTEAVMVNAKDLYPEGTVELKGIKTFVSHNVDETILSMAAILKDAESPLLYIFKDLMKEERRFIPHTESVMYEDKMGLVGWVEGDRYLIGSRELLKKYGVGTPDLSYEETHKRGDRQVTYLSKAGKLIAMFVTVYKQNPYVMEELNRAQNSGISILVRTTDNNITADKIAKDFGMFYRSVKVLPTGLGNVYKEAAAEKEEKSRAYLSTRGNFLSLIRSISASVRIKSNIVLSVVIQLIAVVIGFLLGATISLYSGIGSIKITGFLLYSLFWIIATLVAPAIKKP